MLILAFTFLQALDLLTTLCFLRAGVAEANPLLRAAMATSPPAAWIYLAAAKLAGCGLALAAWRGGRTRLLRSVNWIFAGCVCWNLLALAGS